MRRVAVALLVLLLASACSSGGGSSRGDEAGGPTTSTTVPAGFSIVDQSDGQLEVATGAFRIRMALDPFRMDAASGDGAAVEQRSSFFVEGDGLYIVRDGEDVGVDRARVRRAEPALGNHTVTHWQSYASSDPARDQHP